VATNYSHSHEPYQSKWNEVQRLNTKLDALDDLLLQLTSDQTGLFEGSSIGFVSSTSGGDYIHVGTFDHDTDPAGYFMLVNRRCGSKDTQSLTVTLDATQLEGSGYPYTVKDMYSGKTYVTGNGSGITFTTTLQPGEGKLFRVQQRLPKVPDISIPPWQETIPDIILPDPPPHRDKR